MIFKSGEQKVSTGDSPWRAESGRRPRRSRCAAIFRFPPSAFRFGLTLIELLITITILATLAGVFLGVSGAAMESARSARTKTTISKIHTLLMERWESYSTRRVELNPALETAIRSLNRDIRGQVMTDARMLATRELMKLEMPDRWSDILQAASADTDGDGYPGPDLLATTPAITRLYRRQHQKAVNVASAASDPNAVLSNQRAECLFLVVMFHSGDGEARTLFSRQDIGDTDGDGAQEFLDGWGRPIQFIRWPAGFFVSSDLMTGDAETDHDPFDPFRRDLIDQNQNLTPADSAYSGLGSLETYVVNRMRDRLRNENISAYRLVPLIYSVGNDGAAGLRSGAGDFVAGLDPYSLDDRNADGNLLGFPMDKEALDNIHNHLLDGS